MSKPIPIPTKRKYVNDFCENRVGEDIKYRSSSCHRSDPMRKLGYYSRSDPERSHNGAILVYPGVCHSARGIITKTTSNYNSYNSLRSVLGRSPTSISMTYIPPDSVADSIQYVYTLHYDGEAQTKKNPSEFNQIISSFSNKDFWGKVILVDENVGWPVIQSLHDGIGEDFTKGST